MCAMDRDNIIMSGGFDFSGNLLNDNWIYNKSNLSFDSEYDIDLLYLFRTL